jgi:UDP-glucuronate 4-epimerase
MACSDIQAMKNRILVTGAAGFIGSNLIDNLLKSGNEVLGIDNFDTYYKRTIKEGNIEDAKLHKEFQFQEGDIRNTAFLNDCFTQFNPNLVVHLAAKAGVRPSIVDPHGYYDVNVTGTLNLLEMMRKHNIKKLIFASSSSVYGNNTKVPFSETDNVDYPISPYAASKKAGELLCYSYHHLYNFDIFCLRFFTVYGPRQRPDLAIHKFTKALFEETPIPFYGTGMTKRDYTHIDDIIQGILNSLDRLIGYEIFNIGESKAIMLSDLIKLLEKFTNRKAKLNYLPLQAGDVEQTFADISKARENLDYVPKISIEKGLEDFVKWYIAFNDL